MPNTSYNINYEDEVETIAQVPVGFDLKQFIENAGLAVIHTLQKVNPSELILFSTSVAFIDEGGIDDDTGIVMNVERLSADGATYKTCREISPIIKNRAADENSLEYATTEFPVYYKEGGKIQVLPTPVLPSSQDEQGLFSANCHLAFTRSLYADSNGAHYTDVIFGNVSDEFLATKLENDKTNQTGAWTVGDGTYDNVPDAVEAIISSAQKVEHKLVTGDQIRIVQRDDNDELRNITKDFYGNPVALIGGPWNVIYLSERSITIPIMWEELFMQADIVDGPANYGEWKDMNDSTKTSNLKEDDHLGTKYRWWAWYQDDENVFSKKDNVYIWNRNYSARGYRIELAKARAHVVEIPSFDGTTQEEPTPEEIDPSLSWTPQYYDPGKGKYRLESNVNTRDGFIGNFPKKYDRAVVLHAASRVCLMNIKSAIGVNGINLPDTVDFGFPDDVVAPTYDFDDADDWIEDEDSEMSAARMQVVGGKVQSLQAAIQKFSAEVQKAQMQHGGKQTNAQIELANIDKEIQINSTLYTTFKNEFLEILGVPQPKEQERRQRAQA